ncbi:MAG: alpha/beta hydrolase fold domain-containing protein [Alphaproteobacteria bacterium]|nr:alpha/beta hydrolase fold domain-containing protein [Alphaproteobacteria bacterium]
MRPLMKALARAALNRSDAALIAASGGSPRVLGGRTLDPRFQFLEAQARNAKPPPDMTPEIGRAQARQLVYMFGGKVEPGVDVRDLQIVTGRRNIPARIYAPRAQDRAMPVMAYFHFGGGVIGDLDTCHAFCSILAAAMGAPVISVDYRLAPEHRWPAGLEDCIAAYEWCVSHASQFGAPSGRAAVGGDSMGGNFSAIIAQEMKRKGAKMPVAQLLIYPAVDVASTLPSMQIYADAFPLSAATMAWFMHNYLPEAADPKHPHASPLYVDDLRGLAPALIYTAGFDPLVDQGHAYADRLAEAGVPVRRHCFDHLAHAFTAFTGAIPAADAACRRIATETAQMIRASLSAT